MAIAALKWAGSRVRSARAALLNVVRSISAAAGARRLWTPTLWLLVVPLVGIPVLGREAWFTRPAPGTVQIGWATLAWIVVVVIVLVPRLQVSALAEGKERFDAENSARQTVVQLAGGVLLLGGAWLAWAQLQEQRSANSLTWRAADENIKLTKQSQTTERLTRALEHLNADQMQQRLVAIYALDRVSRESPDEAWAIMEVLASYVRDKSPWSPSSAPAPPRYPQMPSIYVTPTEQRIRQDVQAALAVLGRNAWNSGLREWAAHKGYWRTWMDLSDTDLRGADLSYFQAQSDDPHGKLPGNFRVNLQGAHLDNALLRNAHLERATLYGASLVGAKMTYISLTGAVLDEADVSGADFEFATMISASLEDVAARGTNFEDAVMRGADLHDADLTNTNFAGAALDKAMLGGARFIRANLLGAGLTGAHAGGADFTGATLEKADLRGTVFVESRRGSARGLTVEQLTAAITDASTVLPPYLKGRLPLPLATPTPASSPRDQK